MEVEIWSDIACPWCYVGKRRFEAALAQFEHRDDVTITWRSFELDPEAPARARGRPGRAPGRQVRDVAWSRLEQAEAQMTEIAAGEGLDFRFDVARSGNTFDGHRLVHLAERHGLQDAMKERLLRAYFSEGELIATLRRWSRLAWRSGSPEDEVRDTLAGDRYAADVREDEGTAHGFGIGAVPTFVVDRRLGRIGRPPARAAARPAAPGLGPAQAARGHRVRSGRRGLRRGRLLKPQLGRSPRARRRLTRPRLPAICHGPGVKSRAMFTTQTITVAQTSVQKPWMKNPDAMSRVSASMAIETKNQASPKVSSAAGRVTRRSSGLNSVLSTPNTTAANSSDPALST